MKFQWLLHATGLRIRYDRPRTAAQVSAIVRRIDEHVRKLEAERVALELELLPIPGTHLRLDRNWTASRYPADFVLGAPSDIQPVMYGIGYDTNDSEPPQELRSKALLMLALWKRGFSLHCKRHQILEYAKDLALQEFEQRERLI